MPDVEPKAWRSDARAKVTGATRYADDLKFPYLAHAVPVYTDAVHARIRNILTDEAERSPGVLRVITARDVLGSNRFGQILKDYHILADDKIRFWGDVAAVVVAESREQAIDAGHRVRIEIEELPVLLDPEEALRRTDVLVHEEHGSNLIHQHRIRKGDVGRGFAEADLIIEQSFETQLVEHAYLEPESAVCLLRSDGVIEVYGGMQHPFSTRRFVAAFLGADLAGVEIVGTPVGGGFGGKDDTEAIVCARTALAARLTGRPVKMTYDREWSMRESYKRHPYRLWYRMGIGRDGRIRAVQCRIVADAGAYCSTSPWVTWRSTVQCCGPYQVEHVCCDVLSVYTNNVFTGAMRGFGSPQVNFAVEQLIDMAAEKMALSPIEFRRRNMVRQGSVTITGQVLDNHVISLEHALARTVEEIDFERKLERCSYGRSQGEEWYGIGLAMSYRGMSLGAEGADVCAAIVNVQFDGSVLLEVGIHENGQGAESAMILLLADELGIRRERIRYRRPSTSAIPDSGTTVASRGTLMGGGAVVRAAAELKRKLSGRVASDLGCSPDEVMFAQDELLNRDGTRRIGFTEAVQRLFLDQQYPYALGVFPAPRVSWDEERGRGNAYFTWVYGCQAVELSVDRKSGKVRLLHAVAVHDVGRAVNRAMVLGQFYGGMAMGTGYALFEEVKTDRGRIHSLNFNSYRIPRSVDLPEMKAVILENRDPQSPSGAKGIGEPTNELMAPAIANAVYRATGKRPFRLPVKLERDERGTRS